MNSIRERVLREAVARLSSAIAPIPVLRMPAVPVARDADLLARLSRDADAVAILSIPFADDETGRQIGEKGREFGTVTGRARRCGWFDAVLVRQTIKTSGIDGIALTKLDILDGFSEIKVCVGYRLDGHVIDYLPASESAQKRLEPVYETIPGWADSTAGARSWADLPAEAIKYVRRVEELIGAPVTLLSTSPERDDTILVKNPFEA